LAGSFTCRKPKDNAAAILTQLDWIQDPVTTYRKPIAAPAPSRARTRRANNEDRFPPPDWAITEFTRAATGQGETYTPYRGDTGVLENLAPAISELLGIPVDPAGELVLTPGTQGALFAALASVVDTDDTVLLPDPDYLSTERTIRFFGGQVELIPLHFGADGAHLDLDALTEAMRRGPKAMVFSNPNNPTGFVYDKATLETIARLAAENGVVLIADQLYCRLVYGETEFVHLAALPGARGRTITLLGPSKTESLSGYRLGCLVAPAQLATAVEDVQSVSALRAPAYAQHLLARWLRDDKDYLASRIKEYQELRDTAVTALRKTEYLDVFPSQGSSYLFPKFAGVTIPDQVVATRLLSDAGVIVNPGYQFGPRGIGGFRLCVAQEESAWDAALERILACLNALAVEYSVSA
jgi:aspartate/methionine/tyrosine aminotransferase